MAHRTAPPRIRPRPLLITADQALLDDLLRVAATVGVEFDVAPEPTAARRSYPKAPLILVGDDVIAACVAARLPRRPGVILVSARMGVTPPFALADALGAEYIALLPVAEPWLAGRIADASGTTSGGARVVAVLGGRGGAGASVFAAGLAVTAGRAGLRTLLVDADPLGGGIDLVLGWEALDGLRWPELLHTSGAVSPPALVEALPNRDALATVSWGRGQPMHAPLDAMAATLDAGRRGRDLIVVDLPRSLDDPAVLALETADRVYLVVPAELRASVAAAKVADAAKIHTAALEVIVRLPSPGRLTATEVVQSLRLPLAGELRSEQRIPQHLERGTPPGGSGRGPLATVCRRLLSDLDLIGPGEAA